MLPSLRGLARRLGSVGPGFVNTFLRDNKVLPPVLALLALVVFAWVVAGTFFGGSDGERVSNQANVAQSQNVPGEDPVAPEAENRDVDSYAAYRNKDPFRQLLAPAEGTSAQPSGETTQPPDEDTSGTSDAGGGDSTNGDGASRSQDTDNDGLTDRREAALAQDPQNPDTDGDGTPDGADDADGDGQPDGRVSGAGGSDASPDASASPDAGSGTDSGGTTDASPPSSGNTGGSDSGGGGDDGGNGRPGRDDDLLDSGGNLYAP
jgi:hypothetical protein